MVRAEVSLLGIWQEAYTHSYPILAFLPDRLPPICQLINRQLLHPKTSPLHTPYWDILSWCKTHLKSTTRQSPTWGGWCDSWSEHPFPASVPKVPWKGGMAQGKGERNQAQDIPSWWREGRAIQKEPTFQDYWSGPFHENHILYAAGFRGCWLGFFNVGIGFLLPAPQTDLFLILK